MPPARIAEPRDADAVVRVLRRSITELCVADHHNDPTTLQKWLENKTVENFYCWLATESNFCVVTESSAAINGVGLVNHAGEILLCYVAPESQGHGYGSAILAALEESVKPWLSANVRGATLLGGYEEADPRLSSDMRRTINEILGAGEWTVIKKPWESRRDAMLDVLGKATAYTFKPILQLDSVNALPLIEALSGRWSFERERRDTKNASWYIANAFGLLLARSELWKAMQKPPMVQRLPPSWMSC